MHGTVDKDRRKGDRDRGGGHQRIDIPLDPSGIRPVAGDLAEIEDARVRKAELRSLLDRVDADYQLVQALDPQLNARYLDIWQSSGERAAFEYGIETVEQLVEDPDYDPCIYLPTE